MSSRRSSNVAMIGVGLGKRDVGGAGQSPVGVQARARALQGVTVLFHLQRQGEESISCEPSSIHGIITQKDHYSPVSTLSITDH